MSKRVVFKINKDGNVVVDEVSGYGTSCLDLTRVLEKNLGKADESSRQYTEELHEKSACTENTEQISH